MLSLERLTIRDFGPYRGLQEIKFSRPEGVFIIYGPNGRGKTTLHNAIRYALYGEIRGRRRNEQPIDLANSEAVKEAGFASFETILDFVHEQNRYRLRRQLDERSNPRETVLLERDDTPLSQDQTVRTLKQLAPPSVSQFFLFDGEVLRHYENLLEPDSEEGEALTESIERVLGIPIVDNACKDIGEIHRFAERQLAQQYAADNKTSRMGAALNEAQQVRDRLLEARAQLQRRIEHAQSQVAEIEDELRVQRKAERLLGNLDEVKARLSRLKEQEERAIGDLIELSDGVWKAVLAETARQRLSTVDVEVETAEHDMQKWAAASRDFRHLRSSLDCPTCQQHLDSNHRTALLDQLKRETRADRRTEIDQRLVQSRSRRKVLIDLATADARLVVERDKAIRRVRLEIQIAQDEIADIEQQLGRLSEDKLRTLIAQRDGQKALLSRNRERLQDNADELSDQEAAIEELKRNLLKAPVRLDPLIARKEEVTESLIELFGAAIDAYRAKLRRDVEQRASEIFRQLSSEPDYVGLRLTTGYGLEIIDADGEIVRRSAGYEHLVALSLVAALQDSAAIRGPVLMDYPFGRLDSENTARVVAALPRMARQVLLLSFDGEFDRNEALKALGSDLVAEYELERVSSKHTVIRARTGN